MDDPLGVGAAAAAAFAGTNIDDVLLLAVLFGAGRATGRPAAWQVWLGQYAGLGVLVGASLAAALGLTLLPDRWVGLLGLVPVALGAKGLAEAARGGEEERAAAVPAGGALAVAGVTIANGGDNVAVYTPMFRALEPAEVALAISLFAVLAAVICLAGDRLAGHRRVAALMERSGHWIVPAVFVLVGLAIVVETDLLGALRAEP